MRITRYGTQSTVQSMSIILGRGHRLLHVRTLLARWNGREQEIPQVHHRSPLDSELLYKERATPRAPLREEAKGLRVLRRESAQKEVQEERISWVSTTGSSATRNSARKCLTSVALKNYVVKWTNWRTKTTRTTSLQKKLVCTATIGGSVRTQLVPIRYQSGIKQALSTLRQLKHQEDTAHQQRWKSYSSSWWNWQESWWNSSYEHHHEDGPSTD